MRTNPSAMAEEWGGKNPIEIIQARYPKLSKSQKKISDILLQKRDIAVFLSIQELCQLADVTPATVLRFCRELGFSGYAELKKNLQAYHHNKMYPLQFRESAAGAGVSEIGRAHV